MRLFGQVAQSRACREKLAALVETDASAIVEFAVALPLLVVLVVGIFDFGAAFNLKQELTNITREAARFAASQPTNDLSGTTPASVDSVRYLVVSYLNALNLNPCGLDTMAMPGSGGGLVWTYNPSGCGGKLSLQIQRGLAVTETVGGASVNLVSSQVLLTYPFQWHFNSVIQLLVPGAGFTLTPISANATAVNMD